MDTQGDNTLRCVYNDNSAYLRTVAHNPEGWRHTNCGVSAFGDNEA